MLSGKSKADMIGAFSQHGRRSTLQSIERKLPKHIAATCVHSNAEMGAMFRDDVDETVAELLMNAEGPSAPAGGTK